MKTKEVEVQVLGKTFYFNVPRNIKTEDFMDIIDFVENRFRRIKSEAADLDSFKLGLLVAINITEEFNSMRKENESLREVLQRIDRVVTPVHDADRTPIRYSS